MEVKIKKLYDDAVIPSYAKPGDAGLDLYAHSVRLDDQRGYWEFGTGVAIEIPEGYVGLVYPRSSISNTIYSLTNCVGVIDSGYRGEIKIRFEANSREMTKIIGKTLTNIGVIKNAGTFPWDLKIYNKTDAIAQLIIMPYPKIDLIEVKELSDTERGDGGFGHTDK